MANPRSRRLIAGLGQTVTLSTGGTTRLDQVAIDPKDKVTRSLTLLGGNPHSVAASEVTGKVHVPIGAGGDGTIHVLAAN